jgi:hypothetical protein
LKISFEKFGKIQIFEKVEKNSDKTAEEKLVFLKYIFRTLGSQGKEGRFPEL